MSRVPPLDGWIPVHVDFRSAPPIVEWCYLGTERFADPFFGQTVSAALRRPFNQLFRQRTPIDALGEWRALRPGLRPAGFIFHMSRCGSTLVAQLLASLRQTVVLSEASPIDLVLRANDFLPGGVDDDLRLAWFEGIVSALGQPRQGGETHLVIKFDSWNTRHLPLIQRAFPDVPWVFLYRDPVEVLVSQLRQKGINMVPGMIEPGLSEPVASEAAYRDPEGYCARVLAAICRSAVEALRQGSGTPLNYCRLPDAVWSSLLGTLGIAPTDADLERMREVARFDAKEPSFFFEEDARAKQHEATEAVRRSADQWLGPLYDELEALCAARNGD